MQDVKDQGLVVVGSDFHVFLLPAVLVYLGFLRLMSKLAQSKFCIGVGAAWYLYE